MKRIGFIGIFIIFLLGGCGKTTYSGGYESGSDYQYMYGCQSDFIRTMQIGDNGYYILYDSFLYYLDHESGTLLPLCNKADCIHDMETDKEKLESCNAYIAWYGSSLKMISYCNGYVYYIVHNLEEGKYILYRVAENGSKKEEVYAWEHTGIQTWLIHRDVLYYIEHTYHVEIDGYEMEEMYYVRSLALSGIGAKKVKTIYTQQEEIDLVNVAELKAYGNYVYFRLLGYTPHEEEITDDNYTDYLYDVYYVYHTQDGVLSEIELPEQGNSTIAIESLNFLGDRLLCGIWNFAEDSDNLVNIYSADLDGSNAKVWMEGIEQGKFLQSDGEYLYASDYRMPNKEDDRITFQVYDKDANPVDTFIYPYISNVGAQAVGSGDRRFLQVLYNEEKWDLMCIDSSMIGTYEGEVITMDLVSTRRRNASLQE